MARLCLFQPKSFMEGNTFYLTKEGLERTQKEYQALLDFKHKKTMGETPSILHSEDANPEYLSFQEDMSLLDARIAEYENILNNAEIIKTPSKNERAIVSVGAIVTLELDGEIDEFMIVGTMEADPSQKRISNESPIGRALLGAKVGATVSPNTLIANQKCKILKIRYS